MPIVQAPEKELRFTRAGQAPAFWVAAAVLLAIGITLLASATHRDVNPQLPHPLWALLPFTLAFFAVRISIRLTRHAFLILTPLGIEIFPLFRPERSMRLITWPEIAAAEVDPQLRRLTLHFNSEQTSGIHLALGPIRRDRRPLLAKAIVGRLSPPNP